MEREKLLQIVKKKLLVTLELSNGEKHTGTIFYVSNLNKDGDCLIKLKDTKNNYITTNLKSVSYFQANLQAYR